MFLNLIDKNVSIIDIFVSRFWILCNYLFFFGTARSRIYESGF